MMSGKLNRIVFVTYKTSVIVLGIERKVAAKGYATQVITEDYSRLKNLNSTEDMIVFYLPEDIMDDTNKWRAMSQICDYIKETGCSCITVGEHVTYSDVTTEWPEIKNHKWIDRPIIADRFCDLIDEIAETMGKETASVGTVATEKKRVLIVDDDPSYAGMVRSWIKDVYKTNVVTAGMKAISFLLKNPVDLILLDYEMPVVDGPQVLQMLRQEEATKDIPVIFLTGVSSKEEVQRVMELKPAGYILKSATREDILMYLGKRL